MQMDLLGEVRDPLSRALVGMALGLGLGWGGRAFCILDWLPTSDTYTSKQNSLELSRI